MIPYMINDTPIDCINHVVRTYHVPAPVILSIMKNEGGRNGKAVLNKNGTYDLGVMQVNETWLPKIVRYGYTREDLQYNACKNVSVAGWIIAQHLAKSDSIWKGIANYHSKTPSHNKKYRDSLYENYQKISMIIHDI